MNLVPRTLLFSILSLLVACSSTRKQDKLLDSILDQYAATIRWGNIDEAVGFLAPDAAKPTAFEIERLKQLQIAGYREQPPSLIAPGEIEQIVQIDFVNRHTQESRSTVERMRWHYDDAVKRWWLVSGLPKLQASN
ncbi:MAG: hypothetical protein IPH76_00930 [Xanthomonadales bacterium]|nr:hypothetical protein [Xanthomonadales bacterium]